MKYYTKPSLAALLITASVFLILGWFQKLPCRDAQWSEAKEFTHVCYSDIIPLYANEGMANGQIPYFEHAIEYPVLMGALMGSIGLPIYSASHFLSWKINEYSIFYDINALVLFACVLICIWLVYKMVERDAHTNVTTPNKKYLWLLAASPLLIFHTTINWDMLAVLFSVLALFFLERRQNIWAGIFIGLGIATKLFPGLILGGLFILAMKKENLRKWSVWKENIYIAITAFMAWLVVNLPIMIWAPQSWARFFVFNSERNFDWGTLWYLADRLFGFSIPVHTINTVYAAIFIIFCLVLSLIIYRAKQKPRLVQVVLAVSACFLIVGKVWSPQYALWILPLVILARPPRWSIVLWQASEVVYFFAVYWELARLAHHEVMPEEFFLAASIARIICLLIILVLVIRDMVRTK